LLLVVLITIYVLVRCYFQPELAPALPPDERGNWPEKLRALVSVLLPTIIVVMVLGSIMAGVATPTEAAAMGVLGALISAVVYRKLSWTLLRDASLRTFSLSGMIMWILFAAHAFSAAYQSMNAQPMIEGWMQAIPGGPWGTIIAMQMILFVMAMVLDPVGIMLITLPV